MSRGEGTKHHQQKHHFFRRHNIQAVR